MLTYYRINSVSDPLFLNLYNLYTLAFPPNERRSWASLEHELCYEKRFCAYALIQNDKFVGFFNYWTFGRFYYIEHFAVVPALRGQSIGTETMQFFTSRTKLPVVLEVELPNDATSIRRIHFYERLGFTVLPQKYAQPPYEGDGNILPMSIMSNNPDFVNTHFEHIKETLYNEVYNYEYLSENENQEDEDLDIS